MADYARMYALLCSAMSEAIDALAPTPENREVIDYMVSMLEAAEEIYIQSADEEYLYPEDEPEAREQGDRQ